MSGEWQQVPLGEILIKSEDWIIPSPEQRYKEVTIRLWGKGVTERREASGNEIGFARRLRVQRGQFILSRIDARNGAFGLVPDFLDSAVVSNDFPAFAINSERILPVFLEWMSRTHGFVDLCKAASEGTTNRVRLKEDRFLGMRVGLPPLPEQRRIVARIDELAAKIEMAKGLRRQSSSQSANLLTAARSSVFEQASAKGWATHSLDTAAPINMGQSPPGYSYNNLGIGKPLLNGPTEFGSHYPEAVQWTNEPTKLCKPGDILLCVRGATTGRMNWADKEYCIGRGLAALTPNPELCLPDYGFHFVATRTHEMLSLASGSTFPNLPGEKLKTLKVPTPALAEQQRIVAYLDGLQSKADTLKALQAETAAELDALLPSVLDRAFTGRL